MKKNEFKANVAYLENAGVVVSEDAVWENNPFSRELYFETPSGVGLDSLEKICKRYACSGTVGVNAIVVTNFGYYK